MRPKRVILEPYNLKRFDSPFNQNFSKSGIYRKCLLVLSEKVAHLNYIRIIGKAINPTLTRQIK